MKYKSPNTLAYFQDAPQLKAIALGHLPVAKLAAAGRLFKDKDMDIPAPEREAVNFYALNHMASLVQERFTLNEPLPGWAQEVMGSYLNVLVEQSSRMLHYLMMIITREGRHLKSPSGDLLLHVNSIHPNMVDFLQKIRGVGEDSAVNYYLTEPPVDVTAAQYAEVLTYVFNNGSWSGGYGGKPWGNIAKTALSFLQGKTSLEAMVDTAYTLAHNNGPMFNKGMLYQHYVDKDKFVTILDIQRSGQIPELLLDTKAWGLHGVAGSPALPVVQLVKQQIPEAFGDYVDWYKVQKLGAVGNYKWHQDQQDKTHKAKVTTFMGKPATVVGEFMVMPGMKATVMSRKAA